MLTYRYHPTKAPKGIIFESDELPEDEGWVDSPKKFPGAKAVDSQGYEEPPLSARFPDPKAFASVKVYVTAVDPLIPVVPTPEEAAAHGMSEESRAALAAKVEGMRREALRYYARAKHGKELPDDSQSGYLMQACVKLDKAGGDSA